MAIKLYDAIPSANSEKNGDVQLGRVVSTCGRYTQTRECTRQQALGNRERMERKGTRHQPAGIAPQAPL